jgi:RND family efflux transporter MFP subunit
MSKKTKLVIAALVFVGLVALWAGWRHGKTEADEADQSPAGTGGVTAAVARVRRGAIAQSLTIAGAFKPFQEIDVHAKVAGYIKTIYVDVGTHVKDGQTLAILEVPELTAELAGADAAVRRAQQEIRRAQGDVERAKSGHSAAHAMYKRLEGASRERAGLVAEQELDNARAKDLEGEAQISSAEASLSAAQQALEVAEANQKQYAALTNYMRITAPFTGVVTARYADTGALISAGTSSSTQSLPVVRLAQVSKLRLVLPIPESLAGQIHLGDPVKVHVQASDQDIVGKVSRFAQSLDLQTRTMETEIDFENSAEKLLPGMYAETVLQLSDRKDVLVVPIEAVIENAGEARILVVNGQHIVEERKVKLGMQGKSRVEVLSGLTDDERVIVGNQSQFRSGEKVIPKEIKLPAAERGGAS